MLSLVLTDAGHRMAQKPSLAFHMGACPSTASLCVDPHEVHQTIGGFGASMTESSAINLNALPSSKQDELLHFLFGEGGARLSAMKATMLSNDFSSARPWSTYDDDAGDVDLKNFSISRDLAPSGSLTLIKRALAAGFVGTIQAYMDYPPDWMTIGKLPAATVNPKYYAVLAKYYARYVQAYADHGVHIDFLEAFNEPTDSLCVHQLAQLFA